MFDLGSGKEVGANTAEPTSGWQWTWNRWRGDCSPCRGKCRDSVKEFANGLLQLDGHSCILHPLWV